MSWMNPYQYGQQAFGPQRTDASPPRDDVTYRGPWRLHRRGLGPQFLASLQMGLLSAVVERVRSDQSLCLEIREDSVNVYYRGGSLMRIARSGGAYKASFETRYFAGSVRSRSWKRVA